MNIKKMLWTEKYRPTDLDELIVPDRVYNKLKNGVYQNLLFYGGPGSGKTSSAKILAKDHPYMYINCSSETGVDVVRTKITEFCSTLSVIDGERKLKVVILDEFDGVSDQYMKALRGTIEQFHQTARFIATCNYFNKIPDNIQSRFECINFDFADVEEKEIEKKYMKRIFEIIRNEGMKIEKDALIELVRRKFPDLRSTISAIQGYHAEGKDNITFDDVKKFHGVFRDLYEHIFDKSNDEVKNYQYLVSNYSAKVEDVLQALGTDFIEYIQIEKPHLMHKCGEICYEVNRHSYESRFVIDPVITMLSLVYRLQNILKMA
jgi:DNA polymerase III delta prime subunit